MNFVKVFKQLLVVFKDVVANFAPMERPCLVFKAIIIFKRLVVNLNGILSRDLVFFQNLKFVIYTFVLFGFSSCNNSPGQKLPKWNEVELNFGEELSYLTENPQNNLGVAYIEKGLFDGRMIHLKNSLLGSEKIQFRTDGDKLSEIFFSTYCTEDCTFEDVQTLRVNFLKCFSTPVDSYFLAADMNGENYKYDFSCINDNYILNVNISLKNLLSLELKKAECKTWKNPFSS